MAREGTALHHRSLLSHYLLPLSVLSCVTVTIRGFVFLCSRVTVFPLSFVLLFCFSQLFRSIFWSISEKYSLDNRNFEKLKLPEYFDPPFKHCFFAVKAFSLYFWLRRKVALCQSGRMAHTPRTVPINVPFDRITPGYRQVVFQFSIISLTNRLRK